MKRSSILESRRKSVNPEIRESVDISFQIVLLGKKEAEISKWMRGTHNFTIDTLVSIENALRAPIMQIIHHEEVMA